MNLFQIGTKIIDPHDYLWGLIWKIKPYVNICRYQIYWCDGTVTHASHAAMIEDCKAGYLVVD